MSEMISFELMIKRNFEMDMARLNMQGVSLSDTALAKLVGEDMQVILQNGERVEFKPGFQMDHTHYVLHGTFCSDRAIDPATASVTEKFDLIKDVEARFALVANAVTNEEKKRVGHDKWLGLSRVGWVVAKALHLVPEVLTASRIVGDYPKSDYFWPSMLVHISEVDFGQGKIRPYVIEHAAETLRKQSGEDLKGINRQQVLEMLQSQTSDIVILRTGYFKYWEDDIFDPKGQDEDCYHSRRSHPDRRYGEPGEVEVRSYAVGRVDKEGRFDPIRCHINFADAQRERDQILSVQLAMH